jgi:hypothetical protein
MQTGREPGQVQRKILLNLKCLFWCLHEIRQNYNFNVVVHSLERGVIHPDIVDSHLGDNLEYLLESFAPEDVARIRQSLTRMMDSRTSLDIDGRNFTVGHYIQAMDDFGSIAAGSYGIISSITPQMRGLFLLEGTHLREEVFAPSNVRIIFGTYVL